MAITLFPTPLPIGRAYARRAPRATDFARAADAADRRCGKCAPVSARRHHIVVEKPADPDDFAPRRRKTPLFKRFWPR
ncbi:MAG: hypothetical protein KGK11_09600 [Sphingomonadales bacterium]|nr:hypothetical protein [Sphingomonadales bacterium]